MIVIIVYSLNLFSHNALYSFCYIICGFNRFLVLLISGWSLSYSNGSRFSTKDNDNDAATSLNCAVYRRGGWWYHSCSYSNLNSLYLRGRYSANGSFNGGEGIYWHEWHSYWYSLKTTEMKISSS